MGHFALVAVIPHVAAQQDRRVGCHFAQALQAVSCLCSSSAVQLQKVMAVALRQVIGDGQLELVSVDDDPQVEGTPGAIGLSPASSTPALRECGRPGRPRVGSRQQAGEAHHDDVGDRQVASGFGR